MCTTTTTTNNNNKNNNNNNSSKYRYGWPGKRLYSSPGIASLRRLGIAALDNYTEVTEHAVAYVVYVLV